MVKTIETKRFVVRFVGTGYRTNTWAATCLKCKKEYQPPTTMMASQTLYCPKCGIEETVNYNDLMDKMDAVGEK